MNSDEVVKRAYDIPDGGFTPGPWSIWNGPAYTGGGADLCIGAGDLWLANMDRRHPDCDGYRADGPLHYENECDICELGSGVITKEQRANAHLIAAAPEMYAALKNALSEFADEYPEWAIPVIESLERARGES